MATLVSGRARARRKHNAHALRHYHDNFGGKRFAEVLPARRLSVVHAGVRVSVVPDLRVLERGREKMVKLEFGVDPVGDVEARVMAEAMLEAAEARGMGTPATGGLVLDVRRGRELQSGRAGIRHRRLIQATCRNVSLIWSSI